MFRRPSIPFHRVFKALIGRPYKLGGVLSEGPLDCFGVVRQFLSLSFNLEMDSKFEGYRIDSYSSLYLLDKNTAIGVIKRYFNQLLKKVDSKSRRIGDIMIIECMSEVPSPAVYAGNGLVLISNQNAGVVVIAIDSYKINAVYRAE